MTRKTFLRAAALAALSWATTALADDLSDQRPINWHQWRGPNATGYAPMGDPPVTWDNQHNIKWKTPIPGQGTSTPVVWGDRIFLTTAIDTGRRAEPVAGEDAASADLPAGEASENSDGEDRERERKRKPTTFHQFVLICLDRESGAPLWQRVACEAVPHQRHHPTSSFAAASAVTDGRRVYCSFGSRGVYAFDMDGNPQWQADLGQFDIKFSFGEGSSPALHGDTLVVNCDHEGESFITALDAATGQRRWTVPRDEPTTWNTPLVTEHQGRTLVVVGGANQARAYDLGSGELVWQYGEQTGNDAIPSPLRFEDVAILADGLKGNPAFAVPLGAMGEVADADHLAWRHASGAPQIATPVLVGGRLFYTKGRDAIVTCLDARTGEPIYEGKRLTGPKEIYASPVAAAGRVYVTGRNGVTTVLDATADELRVIAENTLDDTISGSPAIVGRQLLLRGEQTLYCIAE